MIRILLVAALVMVLAGGLAGWSDLLHLVAGGLAILVLLAAGLALAVLRQRGAPEDLDAELDEAEAGASRTLLRDGVAGALLGGLGLAVTALIYSYALPPFYPLLVGDCPRILPKLDIYEETASWPQAVALIDSRLKRPLDRSCYAQLAERKCRYLIEWSKTLPREQADLKLQEAARWAEENELPDYRTVVRLMRDQLRPTATPPPPSPIFVTPTPSPVPTPRRLPPGTTVELAGVDATYFPPTLFAYLRVADGDGQPITDLAPSDLVVEDDGQVLETYSLSHYSRAPAPICAALVIDHSGSMAGQPLEAARAGARAFLGVLGPKDRVEIIGFSDTARLLHGWTSDHQAAAQALDLLAAQGWTALWDALWLAGNDLAGCPGRKTVVLLTDGADNRSQHTREQVIEQARRVGLSLYVITLRSGDYDGAAMQALVQAVGGRYVETSDPAQLEAYYREMVGAIRNEYRLALTLKRQPDGGLHRLRIRVGGPQPLVAEQTYQDPAP
jgi:VWFA-related protein